MSPEAQPARDEVNLALERYKLALARYAQASGDWPAVAAHGERVILYGAALVAEASSFGAAAEAAYRVADLVVGLSEGKPEATLPRGTITKPHTAAGGGARG